jgi:hypothetical protein
VKILKKRLVWLKKTNKPVAVAKLNNPYASAAESKLVETTGLM